MVSPLPVFTPLFFLCLSACRAAAVLGYVHLATGFLLGAGLMLLWCLLYLLVPLAVGRRSRHQAIFVRGRERLRVVQAQPQSPTSCRTDGLVSEAPLNTEAVASESMRWGGEFLPATSATTHFLVAGTTGAGKTLLLQQLMSSVLPAIGKRHADGRCLDRRALVYDAKGDVLSFLHSVANCRVVTLHPFDARGAAWDIARDITTPAAALQAAALLISPERSGSGNPFFTLAAQNLVRGVLLSFLQTVGEHWTLRDVVLALRYEERLRQVLEMTLEGRAILDQFFGAAETLQGIRATIATKIAPLEVIAALWDTAQEKVSLSEFIEGEFILVLGNDESTRTALDAVNRVLFQRLSEMILSGSESRTRQTWLFLDEVREAGRFDGLSRLMTKGRSKGACVALGFQAIEGMREVYGNNVAEEITGLCNHKAILRLESPTSAQWASSLFDKTEEIEWRQSRSRSSQNRGGMGLFSSFGRARSWTEQRLTRVAVLPSEIMTQPPADPQQGLSGFFLARGREAYQALLPWDTLGIPKAAVKAPDSGTAGGGAVTGEGANGGAVNAQVSFVARPESSQYLREWTAADLDRLGLKALRLLSPAETELPSPLPESHMGQSHRRQLRRVRSRDASEAG